MHHVHVPHSISPVACECLRCDIVEAGLEPFSQKRTESQEKSLCKTSFQVGMDL